MLRTRFAVVAIGLIAVIGGTLAAQGTRPEPDVLRELLVEVRGLRQAMEQIGTAGARVQLSLGRLQLQEQRVNGMLRRAESLRDAIAKAEKEVAQQQGGLAGVEKMFTDDKTPIDDRHPMAAMIEGFKKAIAAGTTEVQRLQAEEAQLQQQIANEQGRWSEINRALEDLERALAKSSSK